MENVVIVGVGNPILSDDGVGIKVVDELQKIFLIILKSTLSFAIQAD